MVARDGSLRTEPFETNLGDPSAIAALGESLLVVGRQEEGPVIVRHRPEGQEVYPFECLAQHVPSEPGTLFLRASRLANGEHTEHVILEVGCAD